MGIVTENLFFGRFRYVEELRRMGADIRTEGHHAVVRGVDRLSGAPVRAFDVRAGAALVLAGLVADGETVITDAHHVDRGYEDLAGKLAVARRPRRPGLTTRSGPGYARPLHGRPRTTDPATLFEAARTATGWRWPGCCPWSSGAATALADGGRLWPTGAGRGLHGRASPAPPAPGSRR